MLRPLKTRFKLTSMCFAMGTEHKSVSGQQSPMCRQLDAANINTARTQPPCDDSGLTESVDSIYQKQLVRSMLAVKDIRKHKRKRPMNGAGASALAFANQQSASHAPVQLPLLLQAKEKTTRTAQKNLIKHRGPINSKNIRQSEY